MATAATCPACLEPYECDPVPVPDREYAVPAVATYACCPACGSLHQLPMPAESELGAFYPTDYHAQSGGGLLTRIRNGMRLRHLRSLLGESGAVLDYGCGNGGFLLQAAESIDRSLYGFEIADQPSRRTEGKVTIVKGTFRDLLPDLPPLGLVTMNHVIEHLPDPHAVISALAARLGPGGVLEGQTPAAGSLEHRTFGPYWSGYHAPRHTVIFSKAGLTALLHRSGFKQVRVSAAFNPAGIAVSLASSTDRGRRNRVNRSGLAWLVWLGLATLLAPVDLLSGSPGIVNFTATA